MKFKICVTAHYQTWELRHPPPRVPQWESLKDCDPCAGGAFPRAWRAAKPSAWLTDRLQLMRRRMGALTQGDSATITPLLCVYTRARSAQQEASTGLRAHPGTCHPNIHNLSLGRESHAAAARTVQRAASSRVQRLHEVNEPWRCRWLCCGSQRPPSDYPLFIWSFVF